VRREQVFWGWGEAGDRPPLPAHASELLHRYLGVSGDVVAPPVSLDEVRLRPPALPAGLRARLDGIAGAANVRDDREIRVLRCRGKSYLDLLAQRAGDCLDAPDAVVAPAGHEQVLAVVQACADAGVAVVPFGGGTSVVGGLEPDRAGFGRLVSLDLGRMDAVVAVDEHAMTAVVEPGIRLPDVEEALGAHGVTLGHLPQS
jgi:alkyldihydroxyacetonephosphate synthase